jgi:integrase
MASVNFYLKEPFSSKRTPIFLQFKYKGQKLKYYIGQSILPSNWDSKRQRVKNNNLTVKRGDVLINDLLEVLSKKVEETYKKSLLAPSPIEFKELLNNWRYEDSNSNKTVKNEIGLFDLIEKFINNEILNKGKERSKNTIKSYKTVKGHLFEFEKKTGYKIDFETINLTFYFNYISFLKRKGLAPNSIGRDIKDIKTFMRMAVDMGLTDNLQIEKRSFSVVREDSSAVYLTEEELILLYKYDFSDSPKLESVRDLFVFGAFVGLRFSDFSDVKKENLQYIGEDIFLHIKTKKVGSKVMIPCNPIVIDIFKKYDHMPNKLPRTISNQKFNQYIKDACRLAGLNQKGRLESNPNLELWECVSSHTARRSFATNLYNEGFPVLNIMKITGHRTESVFLRYIKITDDVAAKRLSEHNKKKDWTRIIAE